MKKLLFGISMLLMVLVVSACSGGDKETASGEKQYELKLANVLPDNDPLSEHMRELAETLNEKSNGQLKVEVHSAGVLGDTGQIVEQLRTGMNVGAIVDAGRFADFIPEMNIFEAPYIFDNYEQATKFTQSDMFKEWMERTDQFNIHVASWNWYQGDRHFWTNKELNTLDDFKGLKVRTGSSPMWQEIIKSFGAVPVSLPGNEVYSAVEQKVVDGMEAQLSTTGNYHEVLSHVTKTSHFYLLTGIIVSNDWYNSLPEDLQTLFDEEVTNFGDKYSEHVLNSQEEMEKVLEERGMTVKEIDLEMLKEASDSVYDKFDGFREIKEEIRQIVES